MNLYIYVNKERYIYTHTLVKLIVYRDWIISCLFWDRYVMPMYV